MRLGRKNRPYYRIVAIDSRKKRNGDALDYLGQYNPLTEPKEINVDMDKYNEWISKGAQPTNTVRSLVSKVATN